MMVLVAASAPAAPAMTMGTVTVPKNMAMMCCNEMGRGLADKRFAVKRTYREWLYFLISCIHVG